MTSPPIWVRLVCWEGSRNRWSFENRVRVGIAPFISFRPERIPGSRGPDDKHGTAEKMSNDLPQTIGIDISKASLDCHTHPAGIDRQFTNAAKGHKALIAWVAPWKN